MTIYAFRCTAANHEVEMFFPMGETPASVTCPEHDSPARRLPSRGSFATVPGAHNATYKK